MDFLHGGSLSEQNTLHSIFYVSPDLAFEFNGIVGRLEWIHTDGSRCSRDRYTHIYYIILQSLLYVG